MQKNISKIAGLVIALSAISFALILSSKKLGNKDLNILLITADDLNWNSVGAYGCNIKGITPNIDKLSSSGMRFANAHVTVAVCQPSRGALATGLYPHKSGIEGFYHTLKDIPTIVTTLKENGYMCAILGKVEHSSPKANTPWDFAIGMESLGKGRDKTRYYLEIKNILQRAEAKNKPFYLMVNSHDPHRPFSGSAQEKRWWPSIQISPPSKIYRPDEITVPGFLPDLPEVRLEVSEYYSSVKRLDDVVGEVVKVLKEEGVWKNTLVMFLSDNGMAFPYAKTNCYLNSTKTPWIVQWPGKITPGSVDRLHFISGIDFFPTVLDAAGIPIPEGLDGKSFLPLLKGNKQAGRETVFTQFHETAAKRQFPMRCIQNRHYGYIFNAWADGKREFRNESQTGRTWTAMKKAAEKDKLISSRTSFFSKRAVEEFYDLEKDPDALNNLIDDPTYKDIIETMRKDLRDWMIKVNDPALEAFMNRSNPEKLDKFMNTQDSILNQ